MDQTSVGLVYRLCPDINLGVNMNMKIPDQLSMVCSLYRGWDHIAMACENWIFRSMMHLWWFWDIYKSILLWLMFCWFFFRVHQGFFLFNLCKKLQRMWHDTLNQHMHIDTMYTSGITHFNTMILTYPCVKIVNFVHIDTTWYEFSYFCLNTRIAMVYNFFKKIKYSYQMGMLKIQY
jgi:hypothetical protein